MASQYNKFSQDRIAKHNIEIEKQIGQEYAALYAETKLKISDLVRSSPTLAEAQKYNRLQNLTAEIRKSYERLTGRTITKAEMLSAYNYSEQYFSEMWAAEKIVRPFKFKNPTVEAIRASVFNVDSGLNIKQRFGKNIAGQLFNVEAAITRGLATGLGFDKIAEDIQGEFNRGYTDAIRVVRTESTRNRTEGYSSAFESMRDAGLPVLKIWLSRDDDRSHGARPSDQYDHIILDQLLSDNDGMFDVGQGIGLIEGPGMSGEPGFDINCRCTVATHFEDEGSPISKSELEDSWNSWAEQNGRTDDGFAKALSI